MSVTHPPIDAELLPMEAVVGWAMYGSYPDTPSRFGPFGVSPTQRGKGIGAVLLDRTLATMSRVGLADAWFLWVERDSPAEKLYRRAGFEIVATHPGMMGDGVERDEYLMRRVL